MKHFYYLFLSIIPACSGKTIDDVKISSVSMSVVISNQKGINDQNYVDSVNKISTTFSFGIQTIDKDIDFFVNNNKIESNFLGHFVTDLDYKKIKKISTETKTKQGASYLNNIPLFDNLEYVKNGNKVTVKNLNNLFIDENVDRERLCLRKKAEDYLCYDNIKDIKNKDIEFTLAEKKDNSENFYIEFSYHKKVSCDNFKSCSLFYTFESERW